MEANARHTVPWLLGACVVLAGAVAMAVRPAPAPRPTAGEGAAPLLDAPNAFVKEGQALAVRSERGGALLLSTEANGPLHPIGSDHAIVQATVDVRRTEHLVSIPTALEWSHPFPRQPSAFVLRMAEQDDAGRTGPVRLFTGLFTDHGPLPVISLVVDEAALFAADSGIYVVGDAIMHPTPEMTKQQLQDARWWKYPGNFHFRGKEWQREARMQVIGPDGKEVMQSDVGLRINGQMTRGFPQHALRLVFEEPVPVPLFPRNEGAGSRAMVLRSAGNDQGKAMMRDAVAHELCAGAGFEVSLATTCVVYINGAYWGLHELRQRIDEKELARRHGLATKTVGIIELRMASVTGDPEHRQAFKAMVALVRSWDGRDTVLQARIDPALAVEPFLRYMAATMLIGNTDWPADNVKFWHSPDHEKGRWYPILGDSDLGLGANAPASAGLHDQLRGEDGPIPDLFHALMRNAAYKARFDAIVAELSHGPFAADKAVAVVDRFAERMATEMGRHCARWRKPLSRSAWEADVELVRSYVRHRAEHVIHRPKEH